MLFLTTDGADLHGLFSRTIIRQPVHGILSERNVHNKPNAAAPRPEIILMALAVSLRPWGIRQGVLLFLKSAKGAL